MEKGENREILGGRIVEGIARLDEAKKNPPKHPVAHSSQKAMLALWIGRKPQLWEWSQ